MSNISSPMISAGPNAGAMPNAGAGAGAGTGTVAGTGAGAGAGAGAGIQQAFVATENKALLWSLLQSHGIFEELPDKVFAAVNADFERVISDLRLNPQGQPLLELNKSVIANMMRAVDKYKVKPMADEVMRLTKLPAQQVDAKQKEFDNLINVPVPKKIDFADTTESDNSDMAQKLAEAIAWREKEFKEFLPTVKNIPRTLKISEEVPAPVLDEVLQAQQVPAQQVQVQAQQVQAQQVQAQQVQQPVQTVLNKKVNFVEEVTIIQTPEPIWHNIQQQLQRIEDKLNLLLLK